MNEWIFRQKIFKSFNKILLLIKRNKKPENSFSENKNHSLIHFLKKKFPPRIKNYKIAPIIRKEKLEINMKTKLILFAVLLTLIYGCSKTEDTPVETPTHGSITGLITEYGTDAALEKVNVFTLPATSYVTTDSTGSFKIDNVEPGEYSVTAAKRAYDTLTVAVTVIAGKNTIADFILQKTDSTANISYGSIAGTVFDSETGNAIPNVTLYTMPATVVLTSASDGTFEFNNIEPGSYSLIAKKSGYDSTRITLNVTAGFAATANIQLTKTDTTIIPTAGDLSGNVIDAVKGTPVVNAEISTSPSSTIIFTDSLGNYSFSGLTPGSYTITITKNYYSEASATVNITAGTTTTADFALTPTVGKIQGSVIDSAGAAIKDVIITTTPETGSYVTDDGGEFTINNVPVGAVTVSAEKTGFVTKTVNITVNPGETRTVVIMLSHN